MAGVDIPPELRKVGIKNYRSNLKEGERIAAPMGLFFMLFEDELVAALTKPASPEADNNDHSHA